MCAIPMSVWRPANPAAGLYKRPASAQNSAMDLISRVAENFSESAHLKLECMDALAGPIAA